MRDLDIESDRVCVCRTGGGRKSSLQQFHVRYSNRIHRNNMKLCFCPGVQSTTDEEREEGGPASKTTLSGEHGRQNRAEKKRISHCL